MSNQLYLYSRCREKDGLLEMARYDRGSWLLLCGSVGDTLGDILFYADRLAKEQMYADKSDLGAR
jgi:hypothetical protein